MQTSQSIPHNVPRLNAHVLSHELKTTFDMGYLVPCLCEETLPGDTWKLRAEVYTKFMPLVAPILHRVDLSMVFFEVPFRLIWQDFEKFFTYEGGNGTVQPAMPQIAFKKSEKYNGNLVQGSRLTDPNWMPGSLLDYLGVPCGHLYDLANGPTAGQGVAFTTDELRFSSLPIRAYNMIWNEYFRDQNQQEAIPIPLTSGIEATNFSMSLQRVCWRQDYFTTALPWAQRGDSVTLPLGNSDVVLRNFVAGEQESIPLFRAIQLAASGYQLNTSGTRSTINAQPTSQTAVNGYGVISTSSELPKGFNGNFPQGNITLGGGFGNGAQIFGSLGAEGNANSHYSALAYDPNGTLDVQIDAPTINDVRRAFALQKFFEMSALTGQRFRERMYAEFGVRSLDKRIDIPKFIGGFRFPVQISETLQTSETSDNSPQGNPSGNAMVVGNGRTLKHYFPEPGIIMGLMYVRPKTGYSQGTRRLFLKQDPFDFYKPLLAHIGEQHIFERELYDFAGGVLDENTFEKGNGFTKMVQAYTPFGYQPRYDEYRSIPDRVNGEFGVFSQYGLPQWTLVRHFDSKPALNGQFMTCVPRTDIFAYDPAASGGVVPVGRTSLPNHHLLAQILFHITAIRPVARFGTVL